MLLKDERTRLLDAVDVAAAEALELYRDLGGRLEHPALEALVKDHSSAQGDLLRRLDEARRDRGDLPPAADPERAHVGAAGAYVRAKILPGDEAGHYAESLRAAAERLSASVDEALAQDLEAPIDHALADLKRANDRFLRALAMFVRA